MTSAMYVFRSDSQSVSLCPKCRDKIELRHDEDDVIESHHEEMNCMDLEDDIIVTRIEPWSNWSDV